MGGNGKEMKISRADNKSKLQINNKEILLKKDREDFFIKDNQVYFIKDIKQGFTEGSQDILVNKIKLFLKKYPRFFSFIFAVFNMGFVGKNAKKAIKEISEDKTILNLGSGMKRIRDDVINIDFYPFQNVDVVADISDLPFGDNSVDAVIIEFVLEHVNNPEAIVREIYRVLKSGGILYLTIPFVASFHSSPSDYYRWTKLGLREMLKNFEEVDCGVRCGPTLAVVYVASEWMSIILSLGSTKIQQVLFVIFMILLFPLRLLDYLISKFPTSENIAYGFYFIGRKK